MEISGLKQTIQITSRHIIAKLQYDDGKEQIFAMECDRIGVTAIQRFIAHVYTSTHKQGKAMSIETFLDAVATEYLQLKLF